ncbi:MAG: tetratricopeptide repeat protein, partial [Akkermansia sp.]|nr:tetratricopeptide repeat protein [Akkermansia sp.]
MAGLAMTMPMVCQAQDPLSSLTKVKVLTKQGKTDDAVALCDAVLKRFGGKGATARQFAYVLPYYAWEKGVVYFRAGKYEEAFNAFKAFKDEPKWRDPAQLARAKAAATGAGSKDAYEPYFTYALFQMANCRYKQAVGDPGKDNGDKAKFEEAIKYFEEYLDLV